MGTVVGPAVRRGRSPSDPLRRTTHRFNHRARAFQGSANRENRADGSYSRWIGLFSGMGESISYDHASKESAKFFDGIMDTLCWIETPPTASARKRAEGASPQSSDPSKGTALFAER